MKEKLYTIPLNDAVNADDECPFCYVERNIEQDLLDFVLGSCSSYMESDTREATDKEGFCRNHLKKMFDYGNTLGNGWILKTHLQKLNTEMAEQFRHFTPGKSMFKKQTENPLSAWTKEKDCSCYICKRSAETYERYMDTFFYLYEKDEAFQAKIKNGKGFCLHHFGDLCNAADSHLHAKQLETFYADMFPLMERNMLRLQEDVSWLIEKFDYRNKDADWKDSKDSIQRSMQKLRGSYPADSVYKQNK